MIIKLNRPRAETLLGISFGLFGLFPLIPEKLKGLPVVFFIATALFLFFFENKDNQVKTSYRVVLGLSSLYIVLLLSIIYTFSFYIPVNKLETTLSLLIVPIGFSLIGEEKLKKVNGVVFYLSFLLSTLLLSIYSFFWYFKGGFFRENNLKVNSFRNLVTEIPYLNDHPIYISIFLGLSLLFAIPFIFDKKVSIKLKWVIIIACILNSFHILILSSKGIIIALFFSFIGLIYLKIKALKTKAIVMFGLITILLLSIFLFPTTERRFREFSRKTTYTELHINNSSSIRINIYKCAIKLIQEAPLLGYGWGVGNIKLKECYKNISEYMYEKEYNSHNQFFSYYLDGGLIAFFTLFIFLINQTKKALDNKNHLFFSLILFFTIIMFTENILERQSGLIIFIFLICFYRFRMNSINTLKAQ